MTRLSRDEARRAALAAQGMASASRPAGKAGWRRISGIVEQINLLQIDSVNVLTRSHYLPVLARAGLYDARTLDRRTLGGGKTRATFEYWAHEASMLPLNLHPLMRWRMEDARNGIGIYKELKRFSKERADYIEGIRQFIAGNGLTRASDLPDPGERAPEWWGWSDGKQALEYLFWTGDLTTAKRHNFERIYDLSERVIPEDIRYLPTPSRAEAMRELLRLSAKAFGVGTEFDLRDYFRLPVADTKRAMAELVEAGDLIEVDVEGWDKPAYMAPDTKIPSRATASALLSPFDPLVWYRPRAERLFDFTYRIEIYTPAEKRRFGYYVLPFLYKGRMAGRLCLKSDRAASTLRVNTAHRENAKTDNDMPAMLATRLRELADFLGLDNVVVTREGDLADDLAVEVSRS